MESRCKSACAVCIFAPEGLRVSQSSTPIALLAFLLFISILYFLYLERTDS